MSTGKGRRAKRSQAAGILALVVFVFLFMRSGSSSSSLAVKKQHESDPSSRETPAQLLETHAKARNARHSGKRGEYHGDDDDYISGLENDAESFRRRSSVANPTQTTSDSGSGDSTLHESSSNDYDLEEKLGADAEDFTQDSSMPSKDAESEDEMAATAAALAAALPSTENAADAAEEEQSSPFLEALADCEDLNCLKEAHSLPRGTARYNFPHFLIIGFQKTATTSLYGHLAEHPQILKPSGKEPEFLSSGCRYAPPEECPAWASKRYLRTTLRMKDYLETGGTVAPFEASTHIVRSGDLLAPRLVQIMPWVRLIISMREPISRAASMLIHLKDHSDSGCLVNKELGECLLTESQINGAPSGARTTNYSFPVATWLESFPAEQVHVIQYEELTEEELQEPELDRIKEFLDVEPGVPARPLGVHNSRKNKIRPEGWRMRREQYEALIELVRPDVEALMDVLEAAGKLRDREGWVGRWEAVWNENLESCDSEGWCNILLS